MILLVVIREARGSSGWQPNFLISISILLLIVIIKTAARFFFKIAYDM